MKEGNELTMLTTEEVARELGVKHITVRSYVSRGLLKAIKRGSTNFVPFPEIERFKAEHSTKPGPKPKPKV